MATKEDDYTKYRTIDKLNPPYEIDDIMGRKDPTYITAVESTPTVSGTVLRSNYR